MPFKMKEHFVVYIFLVILFSNDCNACFKENTVSTRSITTFSGFYENCCCTEEGSTIEDLKWLGPQNETIGPAGTASKVYVEKYKEDEEQNICLSLFIPSASKTASGSYRCMTTHKGLPHFQTHHIDVYDPLYFVNKEPNQYLVNRADSKIYCKARGATEPFYRWYRGRDGQDEFQIYHDSVKYQFVTDGVIVRNVTDEDAGIYKCTASVPSTGEEDELNIEVEVMTVPVIEKIVAQPEDTVIEGESLILDCMADAFPIPEFSWRKISDTVGLTNIRQKVNNEIKNVTWKQENNTIRFKSIKADDAGIYECFVKNFAGNTSSSIEIKVLVPPNITLFPNKEVVEDASISLHCTATGNPPPNITITYEGKSLDEEKDATYETIDNFALIKVNRSSEGYYICNASNEVDFVTQEMYLTVLHKPYFEVEEEYIWGWLGETVELNCAHEANPPANITWKYEANSDAIVNEAEVNEDLDRVDVKTSLTYTFNITKNFAPYGDYECSARNDLGKGYKLTVFQHGFVPSVVRFNSVANVTATSVTFDIEIPFLYKGPDVLGIKAEYDTDENFRITNIHRNRTWAIGRPFKLEKLKPNTTYYVRFAAINQVGSGPWGPNVPFETLDKSAPEPPIWLLDSPQLPPSNVLKWKAPEDNGEPIDYYALRYCPELDENDESLCKEQRIEAATELELSDLQHNTTYNFELIAHNAEGNSTASNITLIISAPDMPSPEPLLSGGAIIGISIVLALLCLVLLDLLLLFWRQQGIIASCCYKKSKKKPNPLHTRDKKGLLKDNGESTDDTLKRPNNGHREYEYNKTTGIITGKHSSV